MKCPKCSTKNPTDSKFCNECGTELAPASVTKTLQTPIASPGKTIAGKYKILSELGKGGMGVVYKAQDSRLKRTVALKFLPAELTQDKEAKKRFIQEAQAAAALNHPQICTIYEVDEADGQTFIAMEYIEGQSLKDKLKAGPLDIDITKDLIIQVAEGLKEAHEKGIVHRDIKPANIMLTKKGQAKITDFGLAKLSWGVDLTKTSTIMGTVAYMSPEQARGEEVDHRTDIWSLGAMLYEILAGERPFIKDHEQALIFSILNDEPKSVSSLRSEVPSYLESIIQKALEKDVIKRFQSIQEFIQDLQKPQKTTLPRAEKSIAVLPFDDMSPEKNQEYFCDGIAEEIINALTQLKDLRVIARTSSFVFKGKHVDVREIGNKLDVGTLLEGSVRKAGNRLRITAQLINVADGSHIWSERYDREMEDVFAIQDEISLAIVDKLKMKLVGQEKAAISKQPTDDLEAYNLYLKGRFFKNKFTDDGLTKAIDLFEKAVKKDPNFALANAELAETYFWHATGFGVYSQKDYLPRAKDAALRAVELDPYLAESHTSLAWVATWYDWDRTRAERGFRRAIELNPNYAPAHFYYALYLALLEQKFDEAFIELNKAIDIDPFNMLFPTVEGYIYYSAGHEYSIDLLIEKTQMVLSLDPHYAAAHHMLADAYLFTSINEGKDLYDKAIEEYKEAIRLGGRCTNHLGELAVAYAASGQTGKAKEILKELEKRVELNQCESFWVAFIYSQMGQLDKAFECLERAYEEHESSLIWVIQLQIDIIRNDPRFSVLLNKMGLGHLAPKKEIEVVNISADISTQKYEKSIVVLPFDDVSPGKDNEYFSDGLTEEIISDLSKIQALRVISRTSAMMLKGTRKSMKTISHELDVQYVLEGSVRKAGNNLRITAQLIDATGDAHLWAEKYGGTLDDVFDIQEKVSRSIVDVLKVKLSPEEDRKIADRPIEDIHVHECYLRARQKILECTEKSLEESLGFLQEGLNVYGANAELYAGLALTYFYFVDTGIRYDEATLKKAEQYASKVKQLNPDSSIYHYLMGRIERHQGNHMKAIENFKNALALNPNDPETLMWMSWHYAFFAGKVETAESLAKRLIKIDPFTFINYLTLLWCEMMKRNWDSAIELINKIIKKNPDFGWGYFFKIQLLGRKKEFDEAVDVADKMTTLGLDDVVITLSLFFKHAFQGEKEKALNLINKEIRALIWIDPEMPLWMAGGYSLINEKEEAFNCIERAIERGWINYPFFSEIDPFLENIRGEPRFKKLMERVKHEWENFEV